ncbi:hypothetical protein [Flavobacterium ammonificans]|uniref:hypothetical protein n=1 Tax=Flavobacterium ammonificans TaxID=1751056 RepID=UPI001E3759CD|nr:hypothetical protein [Flavobacterium ammonificans]
MKNLFSKNALLLIVAILFFGLSNAQVKIGENPTSINPSSILEIESANKGFLMPRIALTATNSASPLASHVAGMVIYNTATAGTAPNAVVPGIYYNDGTRWIASSNTITSADTTDDAWVNNPTAGRVELGKTSTGANRASNGLAKFAISDDGKVGIGTDPLPIAELTIATDAGQALRLTPHNLTDPNGSTRMQIRNDQTRVINFGITNSAGTFAGSAVTENSAFLLTSGTDTKLTFGTDNRPKMTIFADGKMGIGTIFPSQAATAELDINGSLRIRGIDLSTDFTGKNILLTDASGNVSQITTQNFVSQLGIPSIVLAGKSSSTSTTIENDLIKHNLNLSSIGINMGSGWNATNRTYTVPGNGYYEIYASSDFTPLNSDVKIRLVLETTGASSQKIYLSSADPLSTVPGNTSSLSGTANLSLTSGDVVRIYLEAGYNNGSAPNTYQISNQLSTITRKTYN